MAPERSEGATKGLRVLNYVVPCVLMSNFFRPLHSSCTLAAACNNKTRENVAVISSNSDTIFQYLGQSKYLLICKHEKGLSKHEKGLSKHEKGLSEHEKGLSEHEKGLSELNHTKMYRE